MTLAKKLEKEETNDSKTKNNENIENKRKNIKKISGKSKNKKKINSDHRDKKSELLVTEKYITEEKNDKKAIRQRIDVIWMDIKGELPSLLRQKKLNNVLTIMFNKASRETKGEIVAETIKNLVKIASHEFSKGFVVLLSNQHSSYLKEIGEEVKKNVYVLISNRNGVFVVDEICKKLKGKFRKETIEECVAEIGKEDNENKNYNKQDFPRLVYKLFSKKLLKYEIVHELFERIIENDKFVLLYDLFVRNKQLTYFLLSYKGLNFSLRYLEYDKRILELIGPNLQDIVNDVYGVVFVLKVLEMNDKNMIDTVLEFYLNNYQTIFVTDYSVQPLIYIFSQEQKYLSSLFNQLRKKDKVSIDKTKFISNFSKIVLENIDVFINSFTYIIVYFLIKKNEEIKGKIKEIFNGYTEDPGKGYKNKLYRKIKKYKIIKL